MHRCLLFALAIAATLPGFPAASAQEITWQDVAQSMFIVAGTPMPYERRTPSDHEGYTHARNVEIVDPVYLTNKPDEAETITLVALVENDSPIVWGRRTLFFVNWIAEVGQGGDGFIAYFPVYWDRLASSSPSPQPYGTGRAQEIERILAQFDHFRAIGAAYRPDPDDPLLLDIKRDLQDISDPPDFQTHRIAVQRLLDRGEEAAPYFVSLIDDWSPFKYESITYGYGDPLILDGPVSSIYPRLMVDAISELLGFITGVDVGDLAIGGSKLKRKMAIAGWQSYLGRRLSGVPVQSPVEIPWQDVLESDLIVTGRLKLPDDIPEQLIDEYFEPIAAEIEDASFLKGESEVKAPRVLLGQYAWRKASKLKGDAIFCIRRSEPSSGDGDASLVIDWLYPLNEVDLEQVGRLIPQVRSYAETGEAFRPSADDPLVATIDEELEAIARASDEAGRKLAARRLYQRGSAAIPYLVATLEDPREWPMVGWESWIDEPWVDRTSIIGGATQRKDTVAVVLKYLSGQANVGWLNRSDWDLMMRSAYWHTYLGLRLATAKGRLALSSDPTISKAEALRRAIAAELPWGATRSEIEAFLASRGLTATFEDTNYYGATTPRYQAVVPDANPEDDLDETVVVHIFLDKSYRMIGSDVRYLFDLYR
jgi:hypothetical protein